MADRKQQLGLFWGQKAFFFAETTGSKLSETFSAQFMQKVGMAAKGGTYIPEGMQLMSTIQEVIRKRNLAASQINLSLPTRDIIFRSFVVPWMQTHEIKGVVDFEVSKYIPFALDELSYSFHPISFNDGAVRKIRVIFVAIKKDALENYTTTLEQSGLRVGVIEPAPLSLIRVLTLKNALPLEETIAVVEKGEWVGKIIIAHQGVPQFVREFQMKALSSDQEATDFKALKYRLFNEIRISLDYTTGKITN